MVKKVIVKIISAKDKLKEKEQETEEVDDKLLIPMCAQRQGGFGPLDDDKMEKRPLSCAERKSLLR